MRVGARVMSRANCMYEKLVGVRVGVGLRVMIGLGLGFR